LHRFVLKSDSVRQASNWSVSKTEYHLMYQISLIVPLLAFAFLE